MIEKLIAIDASQIISALVNEVSLYKAARKQFRRTTDETNSRCY